MFKCGVIAIVGKPNAGKSTLLNAIIKEKVSIVSPKAQTTRNNIIGILNDENYQIVFVDTPGINRSASKLDDYMQKSIKGAISDVNAIVLTLDVTKPIAQAEFSLIKKFKDLNVPVIVVLTKIDAIPQIKILEKLSLFQDNQDVSEVVPVSSIKNKNVDELIKTLLNYLPNADKSQKLFDDDIYTDRSVRFLVSEVIREKSLYFLKAEVPHGIAVEIKEFVQDQKLTQIVADIICEKQSHKGIIIGHGGETLKKIGHTARLTIQKILYTKVDLKLFVKVKENWKNNDNFLDDIGYNKKDV